MRDNIKDKEILEKINSKKEEKDLSILNKKNLSEDEMDELFAET